MDNIKRSCIDCRLGSCIKKDSPFPAFCVSSDIPEEVLADAMAQYSKADISQIAISAAEVEADNYCKMTRIEETVEFAKKIGVKKIGIGTCVGLLTEASIAANIFRKHGFEVFGVACKSGMQKKTGIGIPERCNVAGENMCNPVLQAKMFNYHKTDLNVLIGLCVGHDSLFHKYSEAPTTTLVVKDRVLGHNTVAALYQADKYYARLLRDE